VSRGDARQQMTDTDRELVDQVVEHRVATTQQLAALLDIPVRTVRYRMEKLRLLGMVDRNTPPVVKGRSADHWYPTKNADSWAKGTPGQEAANARLPGRAFSSARPRSPVSTSPSCDSVEPGGPSWRGNGRARPRSTAKEHFEARDHERKVVPDVFFRPTVRRRRVPRLRRDRHGIPARAADCRVRAAEKSSRAQTGEGDPGCGPG
jgi:DNA-binding CsgD family transcriptional regulator